MISFTVTNGRLIIKRDTGALNFNIITPARMATFSITPPVRSLHRCGAFFAHDGTLSFKQGADQ